MTGSFERLALGLLGVAVAASVVGALLWPDTPPAGWYSQPGMHPAPDGRADSTSFPPSTEDKSAAERWDYDLEEVAAGALVPRLDAPVASIGEKTATPGPDKNRFIRQLLPLVLIANEEVLTDRRRLWSIRHALSTAARLAPEDRLWLRVVAERYRTSADDLSELTQRLDAVPPSIALGAAAGASAWGAEDWQKVLKTLHGRDASAVVAQGAAQTAKPPRPASAETVVNAPQAAIRAYLSIVNTRPTYERFRQERERMRLSGLPLDGARLAAALPRSGPNGLPGAEAVTAIIASERLFRFDNARLEPRRSAASARGILRSDRVSYINPGERTLSERTGYRPRG